MADLDTYREKSLTTWDRMASGWEDRRAWVLRMTRVVNDWIHAHVDPQPGQTFLDIAAGPGDLGLEIAERLGDEGRVILSDFSSEMLEVARRNGEARGTTNVDYKVLDAERMDLADDSVDGAVCRFGYMLMADPGQALKETRRVLRDGGPLAFAIWLGPDRNPWASLAAMTLVQREVIPPPEPGMPGIFALNEADEIRRVVSAAGFAEPQLEEITFDFHYTDDDDYWGSIVQLAGPLAQAIEAQPVEEQQASRAAILESVAQFKAGDGSYTMPAAAWGVAAG
jgi:ubiquinone/menaquinone biosynthesis C-methylase UbiE